MLGRKVSHQLGVDSFEEAYDHVLMLGLDWDRFGDLGRLKM
jgi:hypothetical protein